MIALSPKDDLLEKIRGCSDYKMVFVSSDKCPACTRADEVIKQCNITVSLLLDGIYKQEMMNCLDFCDKYNIDGVPSLIIFDPEHNEVSRLEFAPTQEEFLIWLTNTLVD